MQSYQAMVDKAFEGAAKAGIAVKAEHVVTVPGTPCDPATSIKLLDQTIDETGQVSLVPIINVCRDKKCPFCRYGSRACPPSRVHSAVQSEIDGILNEARLLCEKVPAIRDAEVHSMQIGGGTPSLASPDQLKHLITGLHDLVQFSPDIEITLETTPTALPNMDTMRELGINRISIGIQRLDDDWLQQNRNHTLEAALVALAELRDAKAAGKIERWNADMICGFAGQTVDQLLEKLKTLLSHKPSEITIYLYEPRTQADGNPLGPPRARLCEVYEMWQAGRELFERAGYYEGPTGWWLQPDVPIAQAWIDRWQRQIPIIGLGTGVYTFSKYQQYTNLSQRSAYQQALESGELPINPERCFRYTTKQQELRELAYRLKIDFEVEMSSKETFFRRLTTSNLGEIYGNKFRLGPAGMVVVEDIMRDLVDQCATFGNQ